MARRYRNDTTFLPTLSLLITESADEFNALHNAFEQEIKPRGVIEQMYVADVSSIVWEIMRLRRAKSALINESFRGALKGLLRELLEEPDCWLRSDYAEALALAWFTDPEAKKEVSRLLGKVQLDEQSIEAGAIRNSSRDLEFLDKLLASLEARRNKALGCIAEYRASLAAQLRESSNRIIEGKDVLRLEHAARKKAEAA